MKRYIKLSIAIVLLINPLTTAWTIDEIKYYMEIYVNKEGKLIGKHKFQKHFGTYLYNIKNKYIIKAKERKGKIIEFNTAKQDFYAVYNKNNKIKEIGESIKEKEKQTELSHIHKYNKKGLLKRIDHYKVLEDKITFRYYKKASTYFHYNKSNQKLKEEKESENKKIIYKKYFIYNKKRKLKTVKIFLANNKTLKTHKYHYNKKNKLVKIIFKINKSLSKIKYYKYKKKHLSSIKSLVYKIKYYNKNNILSSKKSKGITANKVIFNNQNKIINLKGLLSNQESYIKYHLQKTSYKYKQINEENKEVLETENKAIKSIFTSYSIKKDQKLNKVEIISNFLGKEFKVKWYNEKEEELFSKIPKNIRLMREFNINNLLNTKKLIFGKVLGPKGSKIINEIIIEIYSKNKKNPNWCYFGNSYYYCPIKFSDKEQIFSKVKIMKAGFKYETLEINQKYNTVLKLKTIKLKIIK